MEQCSQNVALGFWGYQNLLGVSAEPTLFSQQCLGGVCLSGTHFLAGIQCFPETPERVISQQLNEEAKSRWLLSTQTSKRFARNREARQLFLVQILLLLFSKIALFIKIRCKHIHFCSS